MYKSFQSEDVHDTIDVEKFDNNLAITTHSTAPAKNRNLHIELKPNNEDNSLIEKLKVFKLKLDSARTINQPECNRNETSFDSIDIEQLYAGISNRILPSARTNQNEASREEDSVIEKELNRINENLNKFTLDQF